MSTRVRLRLVFVRLFVATATLALGGVAAQPRSAARSSAHAHSTTAAPSSTAAHSIASARPVTGAQSSPSAFTAEQVFSYPFPNQLAAASKAGRIVWVFNEQGHRNIFVAEAPRFAARKLTAYDHTRPIDSRRATASARSRWRGGRHPCRRAVQPDRGSRAVTRGSRRPLRGTRRRRRHAPLDAARQRADGTEGHGGLLRTRAVGRRIARPMIAARVPPSATP